MHWRTLGWTHAGSTGILIAHIASLWFRWAKKQYTKRMVGYFQRCRKDTFGCYKSISLIRNKLNALWNLYGKYHHTFFCLTCSMSEIYLLGLLTRHIGNLQHDVNFLCVQAATRTLRHNAYITTYCSRRSYDCLKKPLWQYHQTFVAFSRSTPEWVVSTSCLTALESQV